VVTDLLEAPVPGPGAVRDEYRESVLEAQIRKLQQRGTCAPPLA
jgi:hypothetical protein